MFLLHSVTHYERSPTLFHFQMFVTIAPAFLQLGKRSLLPAQAVFIWLRKYHQRFLKCFIISFLESTFICMTTAIWMWNVTVVRNNKPLNIRPLQTLKLILRFVITILTKFSNLIGYQHALIQERDQIRSPITTYSITSAVYFLVPPGDSVLLYIEKNRSDKS